MFLLIKGRESPSTLHVFSNGFDQWYNLLNIRVHMLTQMVASSKVCKESLLCCQLVRKEDYCHLVCCREDIWQWVLSCIDSYSPGEHEYIESILFSHISKCFGFKSKYCYHMNTVIPPNLTAIRLQ